LARRWDGLLFRVAKHWIAGENYEDAFARAHRSATHNVRSIINLLGEEQKDLHEIQAQSNEYIMILDEIEKRNIHSAISLKPTQIGLGINDSVYKDNLRRILAAAKSRRIFVWVDMENHDYTTATIDSYLDFRKEYDNFGLAVQAHMKRTEEDVNRILDSKGLIRLCKGAYNESPKIVYKNKRAVSENYSRLMRLMFERTHGFAIATHDERLIEEAINLSNVHHADFEFQMLMGVRDKKKLELVQRGYMMSEYIPYGKTWRHYSARRIREHPSNILLLARSLLSG
jgi:proline dehydrogenase